MRSRLFLLLILNLLAIAGYFIIQMNLGFPANINESIFFTSDSREYSDYAKWLGGANGYVSPVRTFFYPMLLLIAGGAGGDAGLWFMQFLFWLGTCNLVFFALYKLFNSKVASSLGFLITASNISVINLTTFALTEVSVFFFLGLFLFFLASALKKKDGFEDFILVLLTVSILAAIKPVFLLIWYPALVLVIYKVRSKLFQPRFLLLLFLAIAPVGVQKAIGIITYDSWDSTSIGSSNLKRYYFRKVNYFVTQGPEQLNLFDSIPDQQVQREYKQLDTLTTGDVAGFILEHPLPAMIVFGINVHENITSPHPYFGPEVENGFFYFAEDWNITSFYLNAFGILCWVAFLIIRRRRKDPAYYFILIAGLMAYYVLLTPGLVFWAGDRLVLPAIPAWVSCYITMSCCLIFDKKESADGIHG